MLINVLRVVLICLALLLVTDAFAEKTCIDCHLQQHQRWNKSDHAKSMALPTAQSVVANFDNQLAVHHGQQALFYRKDELYMVDVSYDNKTQTYPIKYTFGHFPLQQYLVETEPGRVQVLPFAWDARASEAGGQRWYHNYSNEEIRPEDRLHWRQPLQNWNGMCADCHSDGLKRGYDSDKNKFNSKFTGINVGCASCHTEKTNDHTTRAVSSTKNTGHWQRLVGQDTATWLGRVRDNQFMDNCFSCHALRSSLVDGITPNIPFLDQFTPQLHQSPLYYADGQIKEEVYVYGSFLQSKMFASGVNCLDCHDKHTMKLKVQGNGLCLQCHSDDKFNVKSHHQHKSDSLGAQCVNCHMPTNRYMGVDDRRDHSFKVPRPHVSQEFSTPNACVSCHEKLEIKTLQQVSNQWAGEQLVQWHGKAKAINTSEHNFMRLQQGQPLTLTEHLAIVAHQSLPVITRATALRMLGNTTAQLEPVHIKRYLQHDEDLLRIAGASAAHLITLPNRIPLLKPLLSDKRRAVRVAAARSLVDAGIQVTNLAVFNKAFAELKHANDLSSWRGEGRLNKAIVEITSGEHKLGEQSLIAALEVEPYFEASYINLADFYRSQQQPMQVISVLNKGLVALPKSAALHYSYGLHLIRVGQRSKATDFFAKALALAPSTVQYIYTYALALDGEGKTKQGLDTLKQRVVTLPHSKQLRELGIYLSQKVQDRESYEWFQRLGQ